MHAVPLLVERCRDGLASYGGAEGSVTDCVDLEITSYLQSNPIRCAPHCRRPVLRHSRGLAFSASATVLGVAVLPKIRGVGKTALYIPCLHPVQVLQIFGDRSACSQPNCRC
jgi:hypothetical protein